MKNYIYECIHMQESGPRGVETRPPIAFFPGVCSGGYLFSSGGPTLQLPYANFYLVVRVHGRGFFVAFFSR